MGVRGLELLGILTSINTVALAISEAFSRSEGLSALKTRLMFTIYFYGLNNHIFTFINCLKLFQKY